MRFIKFIRPFIGFLLRMGAMECVMALSSLSGRPMGLIQSISNQMSNL